MSPRGRMPGNSLLLPLSDIRDPEVREKLENMYIEVQCKRELQVHATRKAAIADRERVIALAESEITFIRLLNEAGKHLEPVRVETLWSVYRKDGQIVFDCQFSEQDMRNAMKVQKAALDQQVRQVDEGEEPYREPEEEDPNA